MRFSPILKCSVRTLLLAAGVFASLPSEARPSFDCAVAATTVDRLICDDAWLPDLDRKMADAFRALLDQSAERREAAMAEQRDWLRSRRLTCGLPEAGAVQQPKAAPAQACLRDLYRARIGELTARLEAGRAAPGARERSQAAATEALSYAARAGDLAAVERLIAHGADVDASGALYQAAWGDKLPIVRILVAAGADPNAILVQHPSGPSSTPFRVAAELDHRAVMNYLLDHGADVNAPAGSDTTPLMLASMTRRPALVAEVLRGKPDLNARGTYMFSGDKKGKTALMIAAGRGYGEIVRMLLDVGADPNVGTARGQTALHEAAWHAKDPTIVRMLIEHGADVGDEGEDIGAAIVWALDVEVARVLLDAGADVNDADAQGRTLLHWAALNCDERLMRLLLERGADPVARNQWEQTPREAVERFRGRPCPPSVWPPALRTSRP